MLPETPKVDLIDPSWTIKGNPDDMFIQYDHDVNDQFLGRIRDLRTSVANSREGEFMELCEIPVAVVEAWARRGFDIYKESAKSIVRRLNAENLGAFISTHKSF